MESKLSKLAGFVDVSFKNDSDIEPLQRLIENEFELSELLETVPVILERNDAILLINYIFMGLTQSPVSVKKRSRIIEKIVTHLVTENEELNETSTDILNIVRLQVSKLKSSCLIRLVNVCIEMMSDTQSSNKTSWKIIVPNILCNIQNEKEVCFAGTDMSGVQFKNEIISTFCRMNVDARILVQFAFMIRHIPMTNSEHEQIVNKLCKLFETIAIENLPQYVDELLYLCKDDHIVIVFLKLRIFFEKYLYEKVSREIPKNAREKIEKVASAQLIILKQVEEFANNNRLNDLLKLCKNGSNAACLLLDPFLLAILTSISCTPAYEIPVTDLLRSLITQAAGEEERKSESAWLCHVIEKGSGIDQLFSKIIQSRLCEHENVVCGLINLSFALLAVSGIKSKGTILKKVWRIGRITLVSLMRKNGDFSKKILLTLTDRIITGCISDQYTDCLLHLCNAVSMTIVANTQIVVRVLDYLNSMPSIVSQRILSAIIPLVQRSSTLRDNIIMCLRKALFSRNPETRQTAVLGFIHLLKFLNFTKQSALSQCTLTQTTYLGPSVFTQICSDVHTQQMTPSQQMQSANNSNISESLCLEIVGILKRCFSQQASVKNTLYKGLSAAICENRQLCTLVLDVLLNHFSQYYESEPATMPPIVFKNTISVRNSQVTLEEPIGNLLMLIQDILSRKQVLAVALEDPDDESTNSVFKFGSIMKSLVERLQKCDLDELGLDEFTNISDNSCDSMKSREILSQIFSTYEAAMAYVINMWDKDATEKTAQDLIELYRHFSNIIDFTKDVDKYGKKKENDENKEKIKNDNTIDTEEEEGEEEVIPKKRAKKEKKTIKKSTIKKIPYKLPNTVLDLKPINRILLLYLQVNVEWSTVEATSAIKNSNKIFIYAMNCALDAVQQIKLRLNEEQKSSMVFNKLVSLASLLYFKCLLKYENITQLDKMSIITGVECFSEIITVITTHYNSKFPQFLEDTISVKVDEGLPNQLLPILKVYKNLLREITIKSSDETSSIATASVDDENYHKRLAPVVVNAISVLLLTLPSQNERTVKILEWLVSIAVKSRFKYPPGSKPFMNLLLTLLKRCMKEISFLDDTCLQLSRSFSTINSEPVADTNGRNITMVTEESKLLILPLVCTFLMSYLEDVEYMISRLKSEIFVSQYLQDQEDDALTQCSILKRREKETCENIFHIIIMAETLVSIAVPAGACLESMLKFLIKTFSVLTSLTKYFISRSTAAEPIYRSAQFHKVVKIAGSQLIRQEIAELILHIEKDYVDGIKSLSHYNNQNKKQLILLPKLVSELESFPKTVMQLGKKCKDDSMRVKLTIPRDFRLDLKKVEELINDDNDGDSQDGVKSAKSSMQVTQTTQKKRKCS